MNKRLAFKWVKDLPEDTVEQMRSKESKLTILALRAFPSSPYQKDIQQAREIVRAKLASN